MIWTRAQIAKLVLDNGIIREVAAIPIAICEAESGFDDQALGWNPPTPGCPMGSRDRGLWQLNDCYHAEVSDACAFDPFCNVRQMVQISNNGRDWTPWASFTTGRYLRYLNAAQVSVGIIGVPTPAVGCLGALMLLGCLRGR